MLSKHEKRGMLVRKGLNLQLAAAHATAVKSTHVRSSPRLSSTYAEWLKPYWRKRPKAQCKALFSSLNRAVMFSTSSLSCLAENPPSRGFSRVHWHRCIIKRVALTVACACSTLKGGLRWFGMLATRKLQVPASCHTESAAPPLRRWGPHHHFRWHRWCHWIWRSLEKDRKYMEVYQLTVNTCNCNVEIQCLATLHATSLSVIPQLERMTAAPDSAGQLGRVLLFFAMRIQDSWWEEMLCI